MRALNVETMLWIEWQHINDAFDGNGKALKMFFGRNGDYEPGSQNVARSKTLEHMNLSPWYLLYIGGPSIHLYFFVCASKLLLSFQFSPRLHSWSPPRL